MLQIQILLANKAELENDLKTLNNKLSSALAECNAKDDLVKKHSKTIQEAIIGNVLNYFNHTSLFSPL